VKDLSGDFGRRAGALAKTGRKHRSARIFDLKAYQTSLYQLEWQRRSALFAAARTLFCAALSAWRSLSKETYSPSGISRRLPQPGRQVAA